MLTRPSLSGDYAWGVLLNADDVQLLVKYRLPKG